LNYSFSIDILTIHMTPKGKKGTTGASGFTLPELIMVIVLLSIIAVVAAPRMVNVTSTNAGAFVDKLRVDIRYAQALAMTRNQRIRVTVVAANTYRITDAAGNTIVDPATGKSYLVTLGAGLSFGVITFNGNYVEFDSLGVPYDGAGVLTAVGSVTVVPGALTITVTPQTGAVN
jgi:MSHA pilin protein MshC